MDKKASTPLRNIRALRTKFVNTSFKSPMKAATGSLPAPADNQDPEKLKKELDSLLLREKELDEQITSLVDEGYTVEELDWHVEKLHEYNEVKDAAQLVLGQLAILKGTTVREMHKDFNLPLDD
ncbi:DNA repair protein SWI5 homolog [Ornithodoros turicata]|uniref:DNA repair protein SWI5 homolog n=1 Tax=Ornithodoros turicata TaxID=34597 RepID=UPI003139F4DE